MKRVVLFIGLFLISFSLAAQDKVKNYSINGYLQTMEMVWKSDAFENWQTMTTMTNRMDFRWYPNDDFRAHIGMRNIAKFGQMISDFNPHMHNMAVVDQGRMDLTGMIYQERSFFLFSNFDRANIEYTNGNLVATIGRQRVNWGINLVWNPNDIFNAFNHFDFDYIERPGSDAIRIQYYTGMTSSLEFVYKLDKNKQATYAAMFKFNKWEYDFQFMSGVLNDEDFVLGLGWAGQIEGAGFMGEATYFRNLDNFSDDNGILVASVTANYSFKNSLMIQAAVLFNSNGTNGKAGVENMFLLDREMSAKNFTLARYSLFGQLSFPITPLIKADFSGIFNPSDKSGYLGPTIDFSLTENINFNITGQLFLGSTGSEFGDYGSMFFSRLKWSF